MSLRQLRRFVLLAPAGLAAGVLAAGCGSGPPGGPPKRIALLLPASTTRPFESRDRAFFTSTVGQLCANCKVLYFDARGDARRQLSQARRALARRAEVLVVDPVDPASAGAIVRRAKGRRVPVISYHRLIAGADIDYYVSFGAVKAGQLQAQALVDGLHSRGRSRGTIAMLNGPPTDDRSRRLEVGATEVLSKSGLKIGARYDTPTGGAAEARTEMRQAIAALGAGGFAGVYAANDAIADGAIAALRGAGIKPSSRPTTGYDGELGAVRRVLAGEQLMTLYEPVRPEAEDAALIAVALANGNRAPPGLLNQEPSNGYKKVPSVILTPVAVTRSNVKGTVVKDGVWKPAQICAGALAAACRAARIH